MGFFHGVLFPGGAVGVGALGDEGEALVLDDGHVGAVGAAQDLGGEDLGWRALGDDAAIEADDPGEVGGDGVDLVGGHEDGHALVIKLVEEVHDLVAGLDVDAGGGFVEEEEPGVAYEGPGEEGALLLAAGELPDVPTSEMEDAESGHDFLGASDLSGGVPREERLVHGCAHEHDFPDGDGEVPVNSLQLGDVADVGASRAEGDAVDEDPAGEESNCAEDDSEDGALAGAAGAEESDEVAGHDPEVHPGEDGLTVVAAGHVVQDYDGRTSGRAMGAGVKQAASYWG